MARRFRQLELDEAELDFILKFDPEAYRPDDSPTARLAEYRMFVNTIQSYIADGLL